MSRIEIQALHNSHETLQDIARNMFRTRMLNAAATTILVYDTFLTLGEEVELIWPKKWNVLKVSIYLNRLISFFFLMLLAVQNVPLKTRFSDKFCEIQMIGTGSGAFLSFALCNWILLARTKALLGNRPLYNHLLTLFFFASYGVTAVFVVMTTEILSHGQLFYSNTLNLCAILSRPRVMGFIWICPMIFETTIFLLAIMKMYQRAARTHGMGSKLILVLYRDGVSYYFVIIVLRIWNLLAWKVLPNSYIFTGLFLLWAVMTIAVTRLQLNLIRALDPQWTEQPETTRSRRLPTRIDTRGPNPGRPNFFHRVIRPVDSFGISIGESSLTRTGLFESELLQLGKARREEEEDDGKAMENTIPNKGGVANDPKASAPVQPGERRSGKEEKSEPGLERGGAPSQGSPVEGWEAQLSEQRIPLVVVTVDDNDRDECIPLGTNASSNRSRRSVASDMEGGTLPARADR